MDDMCTFAYEVEDTYGSQALERQHQRFDQSNAGSSSASGEELAYVKNTQGITLIMPCASS